MQKYPRFDSTQAFALLNLHLPPGGAQHSSLPRPIFPIRKIFHPQPHTWLALLLVLFRPSCPSPAACPEGRPRLSPATVPGRKNAARRPRPSAGAGASRLNRCPCHTGPSPGDRAAATPPAGRRGLRTPQPKSPERLGPGPRCGGRRRAPPPLFPRWHIAELTSREGISQPWRTHCQLARRDGPSCWGEGRIQEETFPGPRECRGC